MAQRRQTPIHEAQAFLGRAHLLTMEQLTYLIGSLTTTKDIVRARDLQFTHHSQVSDQPCPRAWTYYRQIGTAEASTILGSAMQLATRSVREKLPDGGAVAQLFFAIWNLNDRPAQFLPMGRLNSATLRAACDELREQFRPYELVEILNAFTYVTPAEAARRAREEANAAAEARTREVIGNLLQNAMLNGGQQNPGLMALMGPGVGNVVSAARAQTNLVFTPTEGGGVDARHVPVTAPGIDQIGGGSSSRDRPGAIPMSDEPIFSPDLPGLVGKRVEGNTIEFEEVDNKSDDSASLFGTRAAAKAKAASKKKSMKKDSNTADTADTDGAAAEEEAEADEGEYFTRTLKAMKRKGESPNPKAMKKEVQVMKAMKMAKK
eukprot:g3744.t1